MKSNLPILAFSLITLTLPLSAAEPDLSKLPPASDKKGVTYEKDIKPLLEESCFRCHGERAQKGGMRLDSLQAALKGGDDGKVITPGKSEKSLLVIAVARLDPDTAMPPMRGGGKGGSGGKGGTENKGFGGKGGPGGQGTPGQGGGQFKGGPGGKGPMSKPLTPEQVGLIRAWIDQGAK